MIKKSGYFVKINSGFKAGLIGAILFAAALWPTHRAIAVEHTTLQKKSNKVKNKQVRTKQVGIKQVGTRQTKPVGKQVKRKTVQHQNVVRSLTPPPPATVIPVNTLTQSFPPPHRDTEPTVKNTVLLGGTLQGASVSNRVAASLYPDTNQQLQTPASFSGHWNELVLSALSLLGVRYKSGGDSPDTGFDCSGLVNHVFQSAIGLKLPRSAAEISRLGSPIEEQELQPGDLVFYNTMRRDYSHVGIYLGDKRFIHAPASGGLVRIEDMEERYWRTRFNGARRILTAHSPNNTTSNAPQINLIKG